MEVSRGGLGRATRGGVHCLPLEVAPDRAGPPVQVRTTYLWRCGHTAPEASVLSLSGDIVTCGGGPGRSGDRPPVEVWPESRVQALVEPPGYLLICQPISPLAVAPWAPST